MRVVTVEEWEGTVSKVVARFALDGEDLPAGASSWGKPEVSVLMDIRNSLYDYIVVEKDKAIAAFEATEAQALRDADLVTGVVEAQQKSLAAAEAHAAHIAAVDARAQEAIEKAKADIERQKVMDAERAKIDRARAEANQ